MERYIKRRDDFKKTKKYADGQARYFASSKGKATKASIAKRFNQSDKGKIVKRRSDAKFRSTTCGRLFHNLQERLRAMGRGRICSSKKLAKWTGFWDYEAVLDWIMYVKPDSRPLEEFQVDHVIPFLAYKWKREGDKVVRLNEVDDSEMTKIWHITNLQLLHGNDNQRKNIKLPSDSGLLERRSLWPSWWNDELPDSNLRYRIGCSRGKSVL
jgi:hypothetical protein